MFGFLKIRKSYSKTDCKAENRNLKLASVTPKIDGPVIKTKGIATRLAYWLNPIRI